MKDKLRELAERWKAVPNVYGSAEETYRECAAGLFTILDAEGDGGAVAWVADLAPGIERPKEYMGIFTPYKNYADHLAKHPDYVVTPIYTHPARSGVVSDEDVETACAIYFGGQHWPHGVEEVELVRISMRSALEHFAKGECHER